MMNSNQMHGWDGSQNSEFYFPRPTPDQPGTLLEQFQIIATYLEIAPYWSDQEAAKRAARKAVLRHARFTATPTRDLYGGRG